MSSGAKFIVASDKRQAMVSNFGDEEESGGNGFQVGTRGLLMSVGVFVVEETVSTRKRSSGPTAEGGADLDVESLYRNFYERFEG